MKHSTDFKKQRCYVVQCVTWKSRNQQSRKETRREDTKTQKGRTKAQPHTFGTVAAMRNAVSLRET